MDIKKRLQAIVGADFVFSRHRELAPYSRDYSLTPPGKPNYVVQPKSVEEIQETVKLANQCQMPLIPSSSRVHFYGATIPRLGGIVLDLRRMNRILEIDERNRKIRIEPGLTWGQLQPELERRDWMTLLPLLPHPQSSAVTSLLEREARLIPKYEYGEPLLTMEVVFPNGEVRRSGSASTPGFPDAQADGVYPQGPGIDWFRLLQGAQGTMGVATWANIKIEYAPKQNKTFFFPFQRLEEAIEPLYRIQRRMLGYECFLLNNLNAAAILREQEAQDWATLRKNLPPWILFLILGGPRQRPEEKIQYEEEALREINAEFPRLEMLSALPGVLGAERRLPILLRRPWGQATYWKHTHKGGCQDLFCIARPQDAPQFALAVGEIATEYGYPLEELGCYLQPIEQARACHLEFNFYYNPTHPEEVERIRRLYADAAEALLNMGAFFSRPYGPIANLVYHRATGYTAALKKVKHLFDPNNILCPGNLCF